MVTTHLLGQEEASDTLETEVEAEVLLPCHADDFFHIDDFGISLKLSPIQAIQLSRELNAAIVRAYFRREEIKDT